MHTGDEIRDARERAGLTQAQLADRVGVDVKTVNNWETGKTNPRGKLGRVREVLGSGEGPVLRAASDAELLAEIARRFERGKAGGEYERSAPIVNGPRYGIEGPEPPHLALAADDPGTESDGSRRRREQDEDAEN